MDPNSRWNVQLFKLNFDHREVAAVKAVVESGWITMGEKTSEFETRFSEFLGHGAIATSVSNGTAALHMALLAAGIGPGDEVIVPALTFVADINVVRMAGAVPVLVDCTSLDDWNVDPADIERKITRRTRAVIVVHYGGYPCNMTDILRVCSQHRILLIEDCAHAPGAEYRGRKCGTFGDIGCFSFFTNKNLSVGEGGMLVTRSEDLAEKARYLRSHGMTTLTLDRHEGRAVTYDVVQPGLNYRIDEMRAALGLVQLEKLTEANAQRKALTEQYVSLLADTKGVSLPFRAQPDSRPVYHIFPVLLDSRVNRLGVIQAMKEAGIQTSIHYPAFEDFSCYKGLVQPTPIASDISRRELTLPLYPTMGMAAVEQVVDALQRALA